MSLKRVKTAVRWPFDQRIGDGNAIPYPLEEWKGVKGKTLADSKPDFVGQKKAPDGAPNVLIVMLDDAGYSSATSFGGVMRTPTFDRLGDEGIRYTHMSVAAVCSPTRGSLLTGYNIHQIGTGIISEFATGYPGYNSQIDYTTPSIAKILTDNGYATAGIRQMAQHPHGRGLACRSVSRAGPQVLGVSSISGDSWAARPTSSTPYCTKTPRPLRPRKPMRTALNFISPRAWPIRPSSGWTTGKGCGMFPFFMYYTPGAVHAPIQVPKEWRDKYKGQFDEGWHAYRAQQLERQKNWVWFPKMPKWWTGRNPFPNGIPSARRGKVSGTADGGQCRFSGTCRLSHRTGHRPYRGNGRAGQHPGDLSDRRQWLHGGRNAHREHSPSC